MEINRFGDWTKCERILTQFGTRIKVNVDRATRITTKKLVRAMVTGITRRRFRWKPLAKSTIKRKGSSTPLVDLGDLVGSITDKRVNWYTGFAGVLRQSKNREGGELANIAAIHVYGLPVRSGGRLKIIKRDFVTPSVKEVATGYGDEVAKAVSGAFRG